MGSEKEIQRLEEEVQILEDLVAQDALLARRASRNSTIVSLSLCFVIFVFVAANAVNIAMEFTEERIADSLEAELREFSPVAIRELKILGQDVFPVYAQEVRDQLTELQPIIFERFATELDQLSIELLASVHRHLDEVQQRVLADTEKALVESFPSLASESMREKLRRRLRDTTENAVASTIGDFNRRFGSHLKRVEEALWDLDLADSDETPVELQKKFVHLWLQLLDQEIMEL